MEVGPAADVVGEMLLLLASASNQAEGAAVAVELRLLAAKLEEAAAVAATAVAETAVSLAATAVVVVAVAPPCLRLQLLDWPASFALRVDLFFRLVLGG